MGHEQASTTLNLYTHAAPGRDERIRAALVDVSLTPDSPATHGGPDPADDEPDKSG